MKIVMTILGRFVAFIPRRWAQALCAGIGWLIATFPSPRRRALFANLRHCFPGLSDARIREIALESCRRTVEMALFVLASPYMPLEELKGRIRLSDFVASELKKRAENPRPLVLMIPHFCMMESITLMPALSDVPLPPTGVFYRPFDSPGMEAWIKKTRQKYGIDLLSRKDGLMSAVDYLKKNGCVGILFDQNTNRNGALSLFFDRVCACSEIAGLLVERIDCDAGIFWARRTGFWRAEICAEYVARDSAENIIFKCNEWLENALKTDGGLCRDWLWLHKRWKTQYYPGERFRLRQRKDILKECLARRGLDALPRKTAFFVRMPDGPSGLVACLPALRALRSARPDAAFTLLATPESAGFLEATGLGERVVSLPESRSGRAEVLDGLRLEYPDVQIQFEDSALADADARAIGAEQRFGMRSGRARRGIGCLYRERPGDASKPFASRLELFLKNFGLDKPLDFSPLALGGGGGDAVLFFGAGSAHAAGSPNFGPEGPAGDSPCAVFSDRESLDAARGFAASQRGGASDVETVADMRGLERLSGFSRLVFAEF